jgi:hypothetical protein
MAVGVIGGNIRAMGILTVTIDPASVATITTAEQTFTVNGLRVGDAVFVNKPTNTTGLGVCNARVSAANTLALSFVNPTAGGVDAASETYTVIWFRPDYATGSAAID